MPTQALGIQGLSRTYAFPVDFVRRANGKCPSKEFYDALDIPVRAKFIAIARAINQSPIGCLQDEDKLEKLHGAHTNNLWEMKVCHNGVWYRMLCFRDGPAWWWTHGFKKKGNSTPRNEIDRGVEIKKEYEAMKNSRRG